MQRPDVAIVMARGHPTSQPQIANAFENSGASARVVDDGDPSGLSAGLLVLPGSSRAYLHYPRILRTLGPRRPRVAAWHFEPLPPQEMSARWDDLPIWRMLDSSGSRRARWAKDRKSTRLNSSHT